MYLYMHTYDDSTTPRFWTTYKMHVCRCIYIYIHIYSNTYIHTDDNSTTPHIWTTYRKHICMCVYIYIHTHNRKNHYVNHAYSACMRTKHTLCKSIQTAYMDLRNFVSLSEGASLNSACVFMYMHISVCRIHALAHHRMCPK